MSMLEVLTNKDLVKHIYRSCQDRQTCESAWVIRIVRDCIEAAQVNLLFQEVAKELLADVWSGYERNMRGFDKCATACLTPAFRVWAMRQMHEYTVWPQYIYGFNVDAFQFLVGSLSSSSWLNNYLHAVRPTNAIEMLHMLERKCACCSGHCAMLNEGPGACGLHPYRGKIRHSHYKSCGCALYLLEPQHIPHTWTGHFFKVAFIRDEDDGYKMQLHVKSGDMLTGARDMYHFNLGARNEEWYQPRIKRLFNMRPAVLVQRGCCTSQRRTRTRCDSAQFVAGICLLAPRIPDNSDWSVQQIFGLSRKDTLAYVRRGRGIVGERRRLA